MFLLLFIAILGILLFVIVVLIRYVLLVVTVENISMVPTLEPNDRVLMARHLPAKLLRKGHIVLIEPSRGAPTESTFFAATPYIKRIVALGGETFTSSHNDITANIYPSEQKAGNEQNRWYIPEGHFFAQGDGPRSVDSRIWGTLPLQSVRAVAFMKLPRKTSSCPTGQRSSFDLSVGQNAPQFTTQTLESARDPMPKANDEAWDTQRRPDERSSEKNEG
jgi:signal peptidase I